jgi:acetolactate synthase I/II/III large subunit
MSYHKRLPRPASISNPIIRGPFINPWKADMSKKSVPRRMNGGHAVAEAIRQEGVGHVFCVPGESFTSIMDGLYDMPEVQLITNRHEAAACYMAEAYAKATRNVGVCIVTRGPGATHASIGIHCANQDSTPLVLLVGQVSRRVRGREALQEMNYSHFFGDMTKWVAEVSDTRRIPQVLNRAFHIARSGRPGPVVVALPRDVLDEQAELHIPPPLRVMPPAPDAGAIRELAGASTAQSGRCSSPATACSIRARARRWSPSWRSSAFPR